MLPAAGCENGTVTVVAPSEQQVATVEDALTDTTGGDAAVSVNEANVDPANISTVGDCPEMFAGLELDCDTTRRYVTEHDAAMSVAEPADCDAVLVVVGAATDRYVELHDGVVNDETESRLVHEAGGGYDPMVLNGLWDRFDELVDSYRDLNSTLKHAMSCLDSAHHNTATFTSHVEAFERDWDHIRASCHENYDPLGYDCSTLD